jgi:hypothetical protein
MSFSRENRSSRGGSTVGVFLLCALVGAVAALGVRSVARGDRPEAPHGKHAMQPGPAAGDHGAHTAPPTPEEPQPESARGGLLVDLGNEICPIMKKPVNGRTWSEWNGLRVGHCCPPCMDEFLADPEKHLDELGIEWRPAAEAVAAVNGATPAERGARLAELESRYTVVRVPEGWR